MTLNLYGFDRDKLELDDSKLIIRTKIQGRTYAQGILLTEVTALSVIEAANRLLSNSWITRERFLDGENL